MSVYVDKLRNWGWELGPSCHLIADTNDELHEFAARLGLKREWFQTKTNNPHYDLTAGKRKLAVHLGAIELEDRLYHEVLKRHREVAVNAIKSAQTEEEREALRKHYFR